MISFRAPLLLPLIVFCVLGASRPASAQFETRSITPLGKFEPFAMAVGDFNRDGKPDVAVVTGGSLLIFLGKGDGTFKSPIRYDSDLSLAYSIAAADLKGDGVLDLVATSAGTNTVEVFLGNGDGTFQPPLIVNASSAPYFVTVGDFNNDHKLDLALDDYPYVSVLLGNGDGTFQPPIDVLMPFSPVTIGVGDFNMDGNLDMVVSGDGDSGETMILLGNGDGTLREGWSYSYESAPNSTVVADFRNTGILDLAISDEFGGVVVFLGNGDGTFADPVSYVTPYTNWIATADFNGDGKADLVAAVDVSTAHNQSYGAVSVLMGNGDGTFQTAQTYTAGGQETYVAVGDFNVDGKPDIVGLDRLYFDVGVLLNTGAAIFSPTTPLVFPAQLLNKPSAAQFVRITNSGTSALSFSSLSVSKPFRLSSESTCKGRISVGASCKIGVVFEPVQTGATSGLVTIVDSASSKAQVIELSGQGTVVGFSPTQLNFYSQKVGTKKSLPLQLTNSGSGALRVSGVGITGINTQDFSQTDDCTQQPVAPGASCTITVTFSPIKTGPRTAAVSVSDTGGGSPQSVTLAGTGT